MADVILQLSADDLRVGVRRRRTHGRDGSLFDDAEPFGVPTVRCDDMAAQASRAGVGGR